ncbi:uncharacterized protein LOC115720502 [Cannabis sativa]|uniref:uncharacterized protein LOC115720502 n=1 Tax=Cannabis sativa TaxID=3483 RepID=UPI0029C9EAF9|nr:uncharacterized protein LOC115720502 [Cannabis sativa]
MDKDNPYITSTHPALFDAKVSQLMVPNERREHVRGVVISSSREFHSRYWFFEASGHYSVKSAYKRLQVLNGRWSRGDNLGLWRKLWNMKIPAKFYVFLWRACRNNLPTRISLKVKQVDVPLLYRHRHLEDETVEHVLDDCSFSRQCWQHFNSSLSGSAGALFSDWFLSMASNFSSSSLGSVVVICWALWKARNELVWNNKQPLANVVVQSALAYFDQWKSAKS